MDLDRLPNLQIIGAAKCGTTSLHHYLGLHPQICMSEPKETYFLEREDWREALEEYARCFAEPADVRGDASTSYTQYPRVPHIPERIHELNPETRHVYLVRDPVDRAEAHFQQSVSMRWETRPLEEAFADPEHPWNPYSCNSRYGLQLERYLALFPEEQVMVVDSRDLAERRAETLRSIFAFVGVDPAFRSEQFEQRLNTAQGKIGFTPAGRRLEGSRIAALTRKAIPGPIRRPARRLMLGGLYREVPKERLPDDIRRRVADALRDDTARFRELTGRRFEHWSL